MFQNPDYCHRHRNCQRKYTFFTDSSGEYANHRGSCLLLFVPIYIYGTKERDITQARGVCQGKYFLKLQISFWVFGTTNVDYCMAYRIKPACGTLEGGIVFYLFLPELSKNTTLTKQRKGLQMGFCTSQSPFPEGRKLSYYYGLNTLVCIKKSRSCSV